MKKYGLVYYLLSLCYLSKEYAELVFVRLKNNSINLSQNVVKNFCLQKIFKDTAIIFFSLVFQELVLGIISVPKVKLKMQTNILILFDLQYTYMRLNHNTNYRICDKKSIIKRPLCTMLLIQELSLVRRAFKRVIKSVLSEQLVKQQYYTVCLQVNSNHFTQ